MRFTYAFCCFLFVAGCLKAQIQHNPAMILDNEIRSVEFHLSGAPLTQPIAKLNSKNGVLALIFDHLGPEPQDYVYTISHCNADWQPSELNDVEYLRGLVEDRIFTYENSYNTLAQYTRYFLSLPNANMGWARSGNYLLKLYDLNDSRRLVLVRRFMVSEGMWPIETSMPQPNKVSKLYTHHEIDFKVRPRNVRIQNPDNDVKAYVLQNGRWDNALGPIKPFASIVDVLSYDYQDRITFPAGKEWRFFDISTFDFTGQNVKYVSELDFNYEAVLYPDVNRYNSNIYALKSDLNGRFSLQNTTINQGPLQSDYGLVVLSLRLDEPLEGADVYVFGELSDWQLKPEFKMRYDPVFKGYYAELLLRQGFYNYIYYVNDTDKGYNKLDMFEGNWHETGNVYTILVYFRSFGDRYDRLMSATSIDSWIRN